MSDILLEVHQTLMTIPGFEEIARDSYSTERLGGFWYFESIPGKIATFCVYPGREPRRTSTVLSRFTTRKWLRGWASLRK